MQNKFDLTGKVALITGASKGIGAAIAEYLGAAGAKVVVSSRKLDAVESVAVELRSKGIDATAVACNVGDLSQLQPLVDATIAAYGGLDIVVNNAATNPVFGGIEFSDSVAFDKIMTVNVKGPFELAKIALPHLRQRGGGSIINIASVEGITPESQMGLYSVSKAALIHLSKVLAKEWGSDNIRVNAVCPGLIQTKFSQALWANETLLNHVLSALPLPRIGQSDEVAGLVLFLASDSASYCTGGVYTVDGGYTI